MHGLEAEISTLDGSQKEVKTGPRVGTGSLSYIDIEPRAHTTSTGPDGDTG
jgi:hypothetical protein